MLFRSHPRGVATDDNSFVRSFGVSGCSGTINLIARNDQSVKRGYECKCVIDYESGIGDANNMLYSWLQAAKVFGFHLHVSTPKGYEMDMSLVDADNQHFTLFDDPSEACAGVDLVNTDVWTSMGYEAENQARLKAFDGWIVDEAKMARANTDALFMHCLPEHRGEEVSAGVIDGPQSVVWDEAENRLHVQKALLEYLVIGKVSN